MSTIFAFILESDVAFLQYAQSLKAPTDSGWAMYSDLGAFLPLLDGARWGCMTIKIEL